MSMKQSIPFQLHQKNHGKFDAPEYQQSNPNNFQRKYEIMTSNTIQKAYISTISLLQNNPI